MTRISFNNPLSIPKIPSWATNTNAIKSDIGQQKRELGWSYNSILNTCENIRMDFLNNELYNTSVWLEYLKSHYTSLYNTLYPKFNSGNKYFPNESSTYAVSCLSTGNTDTSTGSSSNKYVYESNSLSIPFKLNNKNELEQRKVGSHLDNSVRTYYNNITNQIYNNDYYYTSGIGNNGIYIMYDREEHVKIDIYFQLKHDEHIQNYLDYDFITFRIRANYYRYTNTNQEIMYRSEIIANKTCHIVADTNYKHLPFFWNCAVTTSVSIIRRLPENLGQYVANPNTIDDALLYRRRIVFIVENLLVYSVAVPASGISLDPNNKYAASDYIGFTSSCPNSYDIPRSTLFNPRKLQESIRVNITHRF
jgi:hypothetical protein